MTVRDTGTITGAQQKSLTDLLIVVLPNRYAVEHFLWYAFNVHLNVIVGSDANLDEVFFRLFEWAAANGRTVALVTKIRDQFPDNVELKAIVDAVCHNCPDPVAASAATTAENRFDATQGLAALQQLMKDDDVRDAVGDFQSDFKGAASQIEILGMYKDLHDLLHTLQFQCYKG